MKDIYQTDHHHETDVEQKTIDPEENSEESLNEDVKTTVVPGWRKHQIPGEMKERGGDLVGEDSEGDEETEIVPPTEGKSKAADGMVNVLHFGGVWMVSDEHACVIEEVT